MPELTPPPPLLNRESAILEFNRRVLAQARRADVPLLERLRYVTIVSSNMDEFFEVRFADAVQAVQQNTSAPQRQDLLTAAQQAHELIDAQYAVFNVDLMPALQREGGVVFNHAERNPAQSEWVARFFEAQVRPLLTPLGLDPAHPFPQVANKSLIFIVQLGGKDAFGRDNTISIVKIPRPLPRVMRLPDRIAGGRQHRSRDPPVPPVQFLREFQHQLFLDVFCFCIASLASSAMPPIEAMTLVASTGRKNTFWLGEAAKAFSDSMYFCATK